MLVDLIMKTLAVTLEVYYFGGNCRLFTNLIVVVVCICKNCSFSFGSIAGVEWLGMDAYRSRFLEPSVTFNFGSDDGDDDARDFDLYEDY